MLNIGVVLNREKAEVIYVFDKSNLDDKFFENVNKRLKKIRFDKLQYISLSSTEGNLSISFRTHAFGSDAEFIMLVGALSCVLVEYFNYFKTQELVINIDIIGVQENCDLVNYMLIPLNQTLESIISELNLDRSKISIGVKFGVDIQDSSVNYENITLGSPYRVLDANEVFNTGFLFISALIDGKTGKRRGIRFRFAGGCIDISDSALGSNKVGLYKKCVSKVTLTSRKVDGKDMELSQFEFETFILNPEVSNDKVFCKKLLELVK